MLSCCEVRGMLGLPKSTEVNRRVAKEKIYAKANISPQLKDMIKDHVEAIYWRNKLAEDTLNVGAGESVEELQVFEARLRQRKLDKKVLSAIKKSIPYKILFVLTYEEEAQLWIEAEGVFYHTDWQQLEGYQIRFRGIDLDAVYENLVRQVSGDRLGVEESIEEAVERDKQRGKIEREINMLEKKIKQEKQFNIQVELNARIKRLRIILEVYE